MTDAPARAERKEQGMPCQTGKRCAKSPLDLTIASYRSEFDTNGPCLDIIIEYLLEPGEAYAYMFRYPGARVLARLAMGQTPTTGMCCAVMSRNRENAVVLRGVGVCWNDVFRTALSGGSNLSVLQEVQPLCVQNTEYGHILRVGVERAVERNAVPVIFQIIEWDDALPRAVHGEMREYWGGPILDGALAKAGQCGSIPTFRALARQLRWTIRNFDSAFSMAVSHGRIDMIQEIIKEDKRGSPHIGNASLANAIHVAAAYGFVKVAKFLISKLPSESARSALDLDQPLFFAARNGHLAMCKFLTDLKDGRGERQVSLPFRLAAADGAASGGRVAVLKFLYDLDRAYLLLGHLHGALKQAVRFNHPITATLLWDMYCTKWKEAVSATSTCPPDPSYSRASVAAEMLAVAIRMKASRCIGLARRWGADIPPIQDEKKE